MEFEQIIQLIDKVSQSNLTSFECEMDNIKLSMECDAEKVVTQLPVSVVETVPQKKEIEGKLVKSPLVGTFYTAPAEDADPFVSVGDVVKKGQVLAIVEAMKLMNEIESELDGTVVEVLVENGEPVEYGQPLFKIQ
jgi:acetyl-CoA carboxylase biotin carboxyl carrier protein